MTLRMVSGFSGFAEIHGGTWSLSGREGSGDVNDLHRVLNVLKQSRGDEKNKHKRACLSSLRVPIFLEPDFIRKKIGRSQVYHL